MTINDENLLSEAAYTGNLELIKLKLEQSNYDLEQCELVLCEASLRGHVEIVSFLDSWDTSNILTWHFAIAGLIESNKLMLIKQLLEKRQNQLTMNLDVHIIAMIVVARYLKHFEIVEYLEELDRKRRLKFDPNKTKYISKVNFSESWN